MVPTESNGIAHIPAIYTPRAARTDMELSPEMELDVATTPVEELQEASSIYNRIVADTYGVVNTWEDIGLIDRPVVQKPAYVSMGGDEIYTGYDAVIDEETNETWYMGRNYMPVQNRDINDFLATQIMPRGFKFRGATFDKGRTTWRFVKPDTVAHFQVNGKTFDVIFQLVVSNSYDGSSRLSFKAGGQITYCQNAFGLPTKMVQGGAAITYTGKHIGGRKSEDFMLEMGTLVNNGMPVLEELYQGTVNNKRWNVKPGIVIEQDLLKLFPSNKKGLNQTMALAYKAKEKENWGSDDFNWFMALTNMTTRAREYGLSDTAIEKINGYTETFLA